MKTCDGCYLDFICKKYEPGGNVCMHYEPKEQKKTCGTCKWRSDNYMSVCVNERSDHLADFVFHDGKCSEWEEKTDGTLPPDDDFGTSA